MKWYWLESQSQYQSLQTFVLIFGMIELKPCLTFYPTSVIKSLFGFVHVTPLIFRLSLKVIKINLKLNYFETFCINII